MDASLMTALLTPDRKQLDVKLLAEIEGLEVRISETESSLEEMKKMLVLLKDKRAKNIPIKYREAIRICLGNEGKYYLCSHHTIISCVEIQHKIKTNSQMKNNVTSTLLMMRKDGELDRVRHNNMYYYGKKEIFNEDGELKEEYKHLLD